MKHIKIFNSLFSLLLIITISSCKKEMLEPSVEQQRLIEDVNTDAQGLKLFLQGAYDGLTESRYYGRDFIVINETRTDNCFSNGNSGRFINSSTFAYTSNDGYIWARAYKVINLTNLVINTDGSGFKKKELFDNVKGQAYALRALCHYDLLTMYGQQNAGGELGVPIMKNFINAATSPEEFLPKRSTVSEVKALIFEDLKQSYELLTGGGKEYDNPKSKVFLSSLGVKALEARISLYFGMWQEAQDAANIVINSGVYSIVPKDSYLESWYKKENDNSIFELAFSETDSRGIDGLAYIYRNLKKGYGDVVAMPNVKESLYDDGDVRFDILGEETKEGITYVQNIGKYVDTKAGNDNIPIIRFEEMVLTSAEALVELGKASEALPLLNSLAKERGVADYEEASKENILKERRREFIFEGLRFNDLMRNKKPGLIKDKIKGNIDVEWGSAKLALPIPQTELDANSNMVQNTGY